MPLDAVTGIALPGLLAKVLRHRELQLEQDRLQRDVELPIVGQTDDGGMECAVGIIADHRVAGDVHAFQRRPHRFERRRRILQRQC